MTKTTLSFLTPATLAAVLLAAGMGASAQTARSAPAAEAPQALPATGFFVVSPDGQAHVHLSRALAANEWLWVQWPDAAGQPGCCRGLQANALEPVAEPASDAANTRQEPGRGSEQQPEQEPVAMTLDGSRPAHYRLRTPHGIEGGFVGMALVAPRVRSQGTHALRATPDVNLRMCAGAEGLNLLTQTGRQRQVIYLSLGYPIESSHRCNAQDEDFIRRASTGEPRS